MNVRLMLTFGITLFLMITANVIEYILAPVVTSYDIYIIVILYMVIALRVYQLYPYEI